MKNNDIKRRQRETAYHIMNEVSKLGFLLCAVAYSMFIIWLWGPMIVHGVQTWFGSW